MSTGSVRSCPPPPPVASVTSVTFSSSSDCVLTPGRSDVEEPDVLGVTGDERATCLHVLAHQHGEQLVGLGRVVERDLAQDPLGGVHGGLPQLVGVHLAEAL